MNITRCENGHFYDGDKHERCPQCGPVGGNNAKPEERKMDMYFGAYENVEPLLRELSMTLWGNDYSTVSSKSLYEYMYIRKVIVKMKNQQLKASVDSYSEWRDIPMERKDAAVDRFLAFLYTKRPDIEQDDKALEQNIDAQSPSSLGRG